MYETSDLRKNLKVTLDGVPFVVVDRQFVKPGKGQAFTRTKLRNMLNGNVIERTFKSGERLAPADLETREMQYLYKEGDMRVFMDTVNYEQVHIPDTQLGDDVYYLIDGLSCEVLLWEGRAIAVTPPTFVVLKVTDTEPGFKGDTSSGTTKPATMSTGLQVNVPLFIEKGEHLKIDTRTGEYSERVKR